jgi:hypothetical protein
VLGTHSDSKRGNRTITNAIRSGKRRKKIYWSSTGSRLPINAAATHIRIAKITKAQNITVTPQPRARLIHHELNWDLSAEEQGSTSCGGAGLLPPQAAWEIKAARNANRTNFLVK